MLKISPGVKNNYPNISVGIMSVKGFASHSITNDEFDKYIDQKISEIKSRYPDYDRKSVCLNEPLCYYVQYYKKFKKSYHVLHQLESLVLKDRGIPKTIPLVQAMFLSELDNLLLTAGHDLAKITDTLTLDICNKSTIKYTSISGSEVQVVKGDLYLSDASGAVSSIMIGPDKRTMITESTTDVLYFTYGVPGVGDSYLRKHLESIASSLKILIPDLQSNLNIL